MSLVPSEIDYEDESNSDRAAMRLSGFTISVMMSLLATGFAIVGFFAFQQLPGGAPAYADAGPALIQDDQTASADDGSASGDTGAAIAETSSRPPDDDLSEPAETTPAETIDVRSAAVEPAPDGPDAPTIEPPGGRAPTVVFDPTIIDAEASSTGVNENETANAPDIDPQAPVVDAPAVIEGPAVETSASETSDAPSAADDVDAIAAAATESLPASTAPTDEPPAAVQNPAAPVDALAGSHVVQVGSFRSEAEAMADWGRIESRFEDLLVGKTYNVQPADLGERGVFYRLRIGPFENNDDAQAYCRTLTDRGKACLAVRH